ncbi:hypothetical protein [Methylobacterium sp. NFXW15]|uniref:hypothetical protein n=1 Tax=Methylobacterium sp. NFXW15 TaxID=2819512 RepID=UPI003CF91475
MQEDGEERRHNSIPADSLAATRQGCGKRDVDPAVRRGNRVGDRETKLCAMGEGARDHVGVPSRRFRAVRLLVGASRCADAVMVDGRAGTRPSSPKLMALEG